MKFKIHYIVSIVVLLCTGINLRAQNHDHFECGIETGDQNQNVFSTLSTPVYTGSVNPLYLASFEPIAFNVYFWVVKRTNGTTDYPITNEQILLEVSRINEFFQPMGICFIYQGTGSVNNDAVYPPGTDFFTVASYAQNNGLKKANSFNVYIHPNISNGNAVTGYGIDYIGVDSAVLRGVGQAPRHVLAHEIAHTFGLTHVWGSNNGWVDSNNNQAIDPGEMMSTDEHVTRNPLDQNYNALSKGDKVIDTPAMNPFYIEAHSLGLEVEDNVDPETCEYLGPGQDNLGIPFSLTPQDVGNPMQNGVSNCVQSFTTGQGIRIREYIDGSPGVLSVQAMRTTTTSVILNTPEANTSFIHQYFNTITTSTNYQVAAGQDIGLKAGDYIMIEPNTDIRSGSIFEAEIEECECESSNATFTSNMLRLASQVQEVSGLILYPNPNNGNFNIVMAREIKENINVEVYDVFGKVVYKDIKQGANYNINALDLSSGMYIVRLSSGDYNETIKFIKN